MTIREAKSIVEKRGYRIRKSLKEQKFRSRFSVSICDKEYKGESYKDVRIIQTDSLGETRNIDMTMEEAADLYDQLEPLVNDSALMAAGWHITWPK
ncbi:hypothetical protein AGMMS49944_11130 [Spirochaetia bacterium]|nr:hypothetical protein AGMMS49944_11130 [Spirochaetia bacterium]